MYMYLPLLKEKKKLPCIWRRGMHAHTHAARPNHSAGKADRCWQMHA